MTQIQLYGMAENWILITRIWNRIMNFRTGYPDPVPDTKHCCYTGPTLG